MKVAVTALLSCASLLPEPAGGAGQPESCWGFGFTWDTCCHPSFGPEGNEACWDDYFNHKRCCRQDASEAASQAEPSFTVERQQRDETSYQEAVKGLLLGGDCWDRDFNWEHCCDLKFGRTGNVECWDEHHTFVQCCMGVTNVDYWPPPASSDDERAKCLGYYEREERQLEVLKDEPPDCEGRFFWLAQVMGTRAQRLDIYRPWWERDEWLKVEDVDAYERKWPLLRCRPAFVQVDGGLCVPRECSEESVAVWLIPRIKAPWKETYDRVQVDRHNETHSLLPMHLAEKRVVFGEYEGNVWMTLIPGKSESPLSYEYVLWEVREMAFSEGTKQLAAALCAPMLIATLLALVGIAGAVRSFSLQAALGKMTTQRGPMCYDVCRALLSLLVVIHHSCGHISWDMSADGAVDESAMLFGDLLRRTTTTFTVLSVSLCLRSVEVRGASGWLSWPFSICGYILRRLLGLATMLGAWTYVFLFIYVDEVPMNSMVRGGLWVWYGQQRWECGQRPLQLWSSSFLVHDLVFLEASPCHNTSIFEGLFQVDVIVFCLVTMIGLRASPIAALLLWPASVFVHYHMKVEQEVRGSPHQWPGLLPIAMATIALRGLLGTAASSPRGWLSLKRLLVVASALACIAATSFLDFHTLRLQDEKSKSALTVWFESLHDSDAEYLLWSHLYELPHVVGMLLLLREFGTSRERPARAGVFGGLASMLAHLSAGMNISNLFVIHVVGGYYLKEKPQATVPELLRWFGVIYAGSFASALVVYLLIEHPAALLSGLLFPRRKKVPVMDAQEVKKAEDSSKVPAGAIQESGKAGEAAANGKPLVKEKPGKQSKNKGQKK
eukprot:TRINITY_DN47373_c0_g1_i1.p1 TRINITY_DN47373_c0_g1~~TRINITY_DN47373_c0_g1_i1.p1  ORF type:complete len:836 (-),score=188.48 TRINITY_DN47373_c0_g1_i1:689-3196(-)